MIDETAHRVTPQAEPEVLPEDAQKNLAAAIPGTFAPTGLWLPPDLPREKWVEIGHTLRAMERGVQWWVGDWLAFGERRFGEEAFAELERRDKTLANWASVSRGVDPSRRREDVPFSHHAEVAVLRARR